MGQNHQGGPNREEGGGEEKEKYNINTVWLEGCNPKKVEQPGLPYQGTYKPFLNDYITSHLCTIKKATNQYYYHSITPGAVKIADKQ